MATVTVAGLRKSYGPVRAVDDVSFEVERGEVFALLGPNGAGKTTTVEVLEGFLSRDGGAVEVLGIDPGDRQRQRWLRTRVGVVLQELAVEPYLTVRQVLRRNAGFYPAPRPVREVIALVGLEEKADVRVKSLSRSAAAPRRGSRDRGQAGAASSTSRPPGSTRRPVARPGTSSALCRPRGGRSCSRAITWTRSKPSPSGRR